MFVIELKFSSNVLCTATSFAQKHSSLLNPKNIIFTSYGDDEDKDSCFAFWSLDFLLIFCFQVQVIKEETQDMGGRW